VTTYTISITADDSDATAQLRLDTAGGQVVLTDLHLHQGNGLSAGQLPAIDYQLLLDAINPSAPTPLSLPSAQTPRPAPGRDRTPRAKTPARPRTRTTPAASTARTPRRDTGAASPTTNQPAANPRTRRTVSTSARTVGETTKKTTAKTGRTSGSTTRAYRRLPDDLAVVYRKLGGAAAVADHYQVPRHTANGWIRRLRDQGIIPTSR
jgi:hypothetical protein